MGEAIKRVDGVRVAHPLFQTGGDGSTPVSTLQVSDLIFEPCSRFYAIDLNLAWHSRLPYINICGITYAFHARHKEVTYAVALWSHPLARLLPQHWLELRRMACSPEMPKNGASAFLAWMARYLKTNAREHERLVSYQDCDVHLGTIYKAAGWNLANRSKGSGWLHHVRPGSNRNGEAVATSEKIRWEKSLGWSRPSRPRPNLNGHEVHETLKLRWEKSIADDGELSAEDEIVAVQFTDPRQTSFGFVEVNPQQEKHSDREATLGNT